MRGGEGERSVGGFGEIAAVEEGSKGAGVVRAVGGVEEGSEDGSEGELEGELEMGLEDRLEDEAADELNEGPEEEPDDAIEKHRVTVP